MVSPASNLIANHGHAIPSAFYRRKGLDRLMQKTRFHQPAEMDVLPLQNGSTVQWFRDSVPGTNITATSEGTIGTGLTPAAGENISATVSQYADYMTFSDMVVDTALDDRVIVQAENMGYRAALSCDTITRNVVDAGAQSQTPLSGAAGLIAKGDFVKAQHTFQATNIEPLANGKFFALVSPYIAYDLMEDDGAGSIQDLMKYTNPGAVMGYEDRGHVASFNGVEIYATNNGTVTSGSPDTYRSYIFAKGGFGIVDLAGRGPMRVVDPKKQRFSVTVKNTDTDLANPEGKIRSLISYNFVFVAVIKDTVNKRIRYIDASSSIAS